MSFCTGALVKQFMLTSMVWELFQDLISSFHSFLVLLELVLLL
jgi:hypothetical protein